ncbi:tail fiber protein [Aquamicrobium phage P14]|uniref:Putative tail fiber assembly protein n=1 Tax=Aquamicrobium phage P14 TaxID=1927013 RepID=A0A1L5C071_9CAUD|nr:tail fiber protein [Aquamicrobium phage P14]APL99502.1 putative tail fiber assembly protein [Aquamicrobium phage P14]
MTFECKNLVYSSQDGTLIDLEVNHPDFGWVPFTASPDDSEEHGRAIYAAAVAGEFGPVAPYDGPSSEEIAAQTARAQRDQLLVELDGYVSNPLRWASLAQEQQGEVAAYRQALLDVPQQAGFPLGIDWPAKPAFLV